LHAVTFFFVERAVTGGGLAHVPLATSSVVPSGQRQALSTKILPPVQSDNRNGPQVPAATASGAQHDPPTIIAGSGQAAFGRTASTHTPC
jgi:hypothetical protein